MKRPFLHYCVTPGFPRGLHCFHGTKIPQLQTTTTICDIADARSNSSEGKYGEMFG